MFLEPYMPEVPHCREVRDRVHRSQARPAATVVGRTTSRGKPEGALRPVSRRPFRPAAARYRIIVAIAAAGVVAGFYGAMAMVPR